MRRLLGQAMLVAPVLVWIAWMAWTEPDTFSMFLVVMGIAGLLLCWGWLAMWLINGGRR